MPINGLIVATGTSTFGWMRRLDPALTLPTGWSDGFPDGPAPDAKSWVPRLAAALEGRTNAEIDSTRSWMRKTGIDPRTIEQVDILVSDTPAGRWVAMVLPDLLRAILWEKVKVTQRHIAGLSPDDRAMEMGAALKGFTREAAALVKQSREAGREPAINATAGFKAEVALLTLVAALLRVQVFYLYERMGSPVIFPPMPVGWDRTVITERDLHELSALGGATADLAVAASGLQINRPHLWPFIDTTPMGGNERPIVGLSPLGELLTETYAGVTSVRLADRESGAVCDVKYKEGEKGHYPPDAQTIAEEMGRALPFVRSIQLGRYKTSGVEGVVGAMHDDVVRGVVRVLRKTADGRRIFVSLYTTASSDEEWQEARRRVAERYGWERERTWIGAVASSTAEDGSQTSIAQDEVTAVIDRIDEIAAVMRINEARESQLEEERDKATADAARERARVKAARNASASLSRGIEQVDSAFEKTPKRRSGPRAGDRIDVPYDLIAGVQSEVGRLTIEGNWLRQQVQHLRAQVGRLSAAEQAASHARQSLAQLKETAERITRALTVDPADGRKSGDPGAADVAPPNG